MQASLADDDDCVKFFLCELGSRLEGAVTDFEAMVGGMFEASSSSSYDLDSGAASSAAAAAAAAKFRIAAALGRYVLYYILYRYILLTLTPGAAAPASARALTASAIWTTVCCSKRSGAR